MAHDFVREMVSADTGRVGRSLVAALFGGVLLLSAFAAKWLFEQPFYSAALAFVAAILLGTPVVAAALKDLYYDRKGMNELVALGVLAAFVAGEYLTSGAVAFFMILAVLVETRTAAGARKAIESLVRLTPTRASRLNGNQETEVAASELLPDDIVRVRPGENIPGDGVIVGGQSTLNQANITGESEPVDKAVGQDVFGGTTNLTGVIDVRITKAGRDTTLGRVQQLVLEAEQTKTPAMRIVDRYASWYAPTVLMIAVIVLIFTGDINRVIAMLIVACPCSIILATPTAMVAALSAAARLGVLVKNVADFERARNLSAMVFDKTGTLTTGTLKVARLAPVDGVQPEALLCAAASVEQNSRHPVAQAVVDVARQARVAIPTSFDFSEVAGLGVRGTVDGEPVRVGRAKWITSEGIDAAVGGEADEGMSVLHVARGGKLLGWIGLEDRTRPQAAGAIEDLRQLGLRQLVMVTGDRWSVARRVAAEMGCTDVQAEVLPQEKLSIVEGLKKSGHVVAVVGDGVNDAPALASGDLSIAMGVAGSDIAVNSASIALMNNNLNRIPFLIRLSRHAGAVISQGIIFSVAYIIVFTILSASGRIHPVLAAVLHSLSSVIVVFNSARLVREGEEIDAEPAPVQKVRQSDEQIVPEPVRAAFA